MKTLVEVDQLLRGFEKRYGYLVRGSEQQSEAWFNLKLGVLSGSNANKIVAKEGSATRDTYMTKLVAEVCTCVHEEVNSKHMDWGKQHEDAARSAYEFANKVKIVPVTFVFKDDTYRVGCSPDGFPASVRGAEIKCPWDSANYIKFLVDEKIKSEWDWQANFNMWVTGAEAWDFGMFDPRMKTKPLHWTTFDRDPKKIARIEEAVPKFIEDMDKMLAKIGMKFGDHWRFLAEKQRRQMEVGA